MKRIFTAFLLSVCLLCFSSTASANSWGLKGGPLYKAIQSVKTWNDYTTVCEQQGNFAIMGSRYHNALFFADADTSLCVYHTAVWQPEDHVKQSIKKTDNGIILVAGSESFTFQLINDHYTLTEAKLDNVTVSASQYDPVLSGPSGYWFEDGIRRVFYRGVPVWLDDFNIRLFPRSIDDVLSINLMQASLTSGENCLEYRDSWQQVSSVGKKTAPVYSAPFGESAWRAGKGKAAVSLKESFRILRGYTNADGEGWTCVMYDVSERTSRIGWVQSRLLGSAALSDPLDEIAVKMLNVDVRTTRETFLTDDPFVSQYPQFTVPEGTCFNCMGLLGNDWAYVSAKVNGKGKFTDGGAIVWGFVPVRDLMLMTSEADICHDIMTQLEGSWIFTAGGSMAEDALTLHADGTYEGASEVYGEDGAEAGLRPIHNGTWYITKYNSFQNKYWSNADYEITFVRENGVTNVKALSIEDTGFSLTNNEGGGGYERFDGDVFEQFPDANG